MILYPRTKQTIPYLFALNVQNLERNTESKLSLSCFQECWITFQHCYVAKRICMWLKMLENLNIVPFFDPILRLGAFVWRGPQDFCRNATVMRCRPIPHNEQPTKNPCSPTKKHNEQPHCSLTKELIRLEDTQLQNYDPLT